MIFFTILGCALAIAVIVAISLFVYAAIRLGNSD